MTKSAPAAKQPGSAYAVFRCSDPRPKQAVLDRFKQALDNIKAASEETKIPPETAFQVFGIQEGKDHFWTTEAPVEVLVEDGKMRARGNYLAIGSFINNVEAMEQKGANYMIRSSLPSAPNETAARDLGDAFNMLYGGTELFDAENEGRQKLLMDIFFMDEKGAYVSKLSREPPAGNP